jgi:hypothetical protein
MFRLHFMSVEKKRNLPIFSTTLFLYIYQLVEEKEKSVKKKCKSIQTICFL